ncbi:MAG: hypothetical protein H7320_11580 [Ferruginibacter sp.]|nr:hypothetical protein [Ferruginibacter sp.]
MKPVYSDIKLKTGGHSSGICKIEIASITTINADIVRDFATGSILLPVSLTGVLHSISFPGNNLKYSEKAKASKAGDYYEISIQGTLSALDAEVKSILETLRFEKLLVIVSEPNKIKRLVGDRTDGMKLTYSNENNSSSSQIGIELFMNSELPAAYYTA